MPDDDFTPDEANRDALGVWKPLVAVLCIWAAGIAAYLTVFA